MKLSLIFSLIIAIAGCTSIDSKYSTSDSVLISDHFLTGSGIGAVTTKANQYCGAYGKRAVLERKIDGCMGGCGSEYHRYYFDCISNTPRQQTPAYSPQINSPTPSSLTIEQAKTKCNDLGFKQGSEGFAKCVLQFSK